MGFFSRRSRSGRSGSEPQAGVAADERAHSGGGHTTSLESYPKGTALRSVAVHAALWGVVGLAALGGVGFIAQLATGSDEVVVAASPTSGVDPMEQRVSAYALSYTTAWLSASKDDAGRLSSFVSLQSTNGLSAEPWAYRDPVVDHVELVEDGLYSAEVLAWVEESIPAEEGSEEEAESSWVLRGFRSAIQEVDGVLTAVGFPAPSELVTDQVPIELDYPEQLRLDSTAGVAVHDFLMAYVTGTGDISRFIAPDTQIVAISPSPYDSISIRLLYASAVAADAPGEAESVEVFVDVVFTASDGRSVPATYLLTLSSRAERWEISAIHTAPLISDGSETHELPTQSSPSSPAPVDEPSDTPTPSP